MTDLCKLGQVPQRLSWEVEMIAPVWPFGEVINTVDSPQQSSTLLVPGIGKSLGSYEPSG